MLKKLIKLKWLAILSSLSLPLCYFWGTTYYSGKLAPYGVSSDLFPLTTADAYLYAYTFATVATSSLSLGIFQFIAEQYIWVIWVLLAFVFTTAFQLTSDNKKAKNNSSVGGEENSEKKILRPIRFKDNLTASIKLYSQMTGYAFMSLYALFFLALLLLGLFMVPHGKGEEFSIKERDDYLQNGCYFKEQSNWNNCSILLDKEGKEIAKGILVVGSLTHIAFFNDNGPRTMQIPQGAVITKEFRAVKNSTYSDK
tara:strand:- start:1878 stop:2639 length:762 start_codon:yes stop_codon:yes gene_type:complete